MVYVCGVYGVVCMCLYGVCVCVYAVCDVCGVYVMCGVCQVSAGGFEELFLGHHSTNCSSCQP